MKHHRIAAGLALSALALVPAAAQAKSERVCGPPKPGTVACHARVVVGRDGKPVSNTAPKGYTRTDLLSAYGLPATGGTGQTIAIVDAYDLPTAQSDLDVYRKQWGLPATTIRKINQTGGTTPPRADAGWGQEIALDLDMASAVCPSCSIMLVEANSSALNDLFTAVDTAANLGADVISNSYGAPEFSSEASYESHYHHAGIPITVSSGDNGYGVEFPAASQYVTAVGGTTLKKASNARGWSETAWSGAGSGCSAYIAKPSWQTDGCSRRTVADVSAVADPATGVAVYDSTPYQGRSGWMTFGGTSVAAPVVAGVYALASSNNTAAESLYGSGGAFNDVVGGSNGSCGGSYLCTAVAGFDGPTGLGTPHGLGTF